MAKYFFKILNLLALPTHGISFKTVSCFVTVCIAVCISCCVAMLYNIPNKFAFFVDNISLAQEKITIGEGSDISYKGVPRNYLEVMTTGDSIKWVVNEAYRNSDTLQYFKINGENPNRINILKSSEQKINFKVHSSVSDKDSTLKLSISGMEVWNEWEKYKKQKEVLLRHFAVRYQADHADYNAKDPYGFMHQKLMRSFFSHKDADSLYLVILDKNTTVVTGGDTIGYAFEDSFPKRATKVQFYKVDDYCYLDGNEDGAFNVDGINYVMKANVKLTEWGAGHVMLYNDGNKKWDAFFPKAMGYVESLDTLRSMASKTGNFLTLKQGKVSYPSKNDIYLPQLSSQIPNDFCTLQFHGAKVFVRNSHNDSTEIVSKWALAPTLKPLSINLGNVDVKCRIGYIDKKFMAGYFVLPVGIALLLLLFVAGPFSPVKLYKNMSNCIYYRNLVSNYHLYLSLLIGLALCYCGCKTLIALKLSYTYPYFEKMTGIIPVSNTLILLLFVTLAMVLNTPFVRATCDRRHRIVGAYPYTTVITLFLLYIGIACYFFKILDPAVSQNVISSYYGYEIYSLKFWKWMDSAGINDTHRSVVYVLLLLEGVILGAWAVMLLFWDKISKCSNLFTVKAMTCKRILNETLFSWWKKYEDFILGILQRLLPEKIRIERQRLVLDDPKEKFNINVWLGRMIGRSPLTLMMLLCVFAFAVLAPVFDVSSMCIFIIAVAALLSLGVLLFKVIYIAFVKTLETLFPYHLVLLVLLIVIGHAAGNFGTAFITLGVVIGLTNALCSVEFDDPTTPEQEGVQPLEGMWQMLFIACIYIVCAMMADNGYLTNYVGFLVCLVAFYFMFKIPGWNNLLQAKIHRRTVRFVYLYLVILLAVLVFLPSICSSVYNPDDVHYSRMARRIMLYSNFENIQNAGYRYTETDAEFMVVMNHNLQQSNSGDPLSNDLHILHPSVSTGQSPVVLNDLCVPVAFFGAYGTTLTTVVFFLLLLAMLCLVMQFSIHSDNEKNPVLTHQMQWRLMAIFMWVGTTLYIYLSYLGRLPFTGRLIPGFGVDAVGEAIETAFLLAFMSAITFKASQSLTIASIEKKKVTLDDIITQDESNNNK